MCVFGVVVVASFGGKDGCGDDDDDGPGEGEVVVSIVDDSIAGPAPCWPLPRCCMSHTLSSGCGVVAHFVLLSAGVGAGVFRSKQVTWTRSRACSRC